MSQSRCFCFPLKTHTWNKSFPHRRSVFAVYWTGHLAAALLKKNWIFPAVRDQRWCRPSTRRLQMDPDHCRFHGKGGGAYIRGKVHIRK